MECIKNNIINNEYYFNYILYNAIETNCGNAINEIFNKFNLLQIYNQIKSIFEFSPNIYYKEETIDAIKKIFLYKDNIYMQAILSYACKYGYYETVKYLINQNIDINADDNVKRAIFEAELHHHYNIVEYLIENGANIHVDQDKLLEYAIDTKNIKRAKYWISKGLNINIRNENNLFIAIDNNDINMVKFIINNGADIHIFNDNPLRYAIGHNHFKIAKYLISIGANVNSQNCYGLEISIFSHYFRMADYLIEKGANIKLHVSTYFNCANIYEDKSVIRYLKSKGFNEN